jgi:hypothetical protein
LIKFGFNLVTGGGVMEKGRTPESLARPGILAETI